VDRKAVVLDQRLELLCKERDAASARIRELESRAEELHRSCAAFERRAEDSETALQQVWPAAMQEVKDTTIKFRNL
jgi:hypothetical protein